MATTRAAIIGSGNIATDLMYKIERSSGLELVAMAGVDPASEGLARARALGKATTHEGLAGLMALPQFAGVKVVYDATSAAAHGAHDGALRDRDLWLVDLTPAALGPFVVPPVNLDAGEAPRNLNMVTCGGQATVPIVAAVNRVSPVRYAEIVASIASRSAGPGTRANIDEFTKTTARAIETVGGAAHAKAIIILNPAEPPMLMRNTVFCLCDDADREAVARSIDDMVEAVQAYVPGYRLKQRPQFESVGGNAPLEAPGEAGSRPGLKVSVFLEVEGSGDYLPRYAGNLDIMTSAAVRVGERLAALA